jgi:REP element-mobilizing transposase RayT
MKQTSFLKKISLEHGGSLQKGRRKIARPLSTKTPIHLVFRSSRARDTWSFLRSANKIKVEILLRELSKKYGVKIYSFANAGNHLHVVVSVKRKESLRTFTRVFTQQVMFAITEAKKGAAQGRFWDAIYYSRMVRWGREFRALKNYLLINRMEAFGFSRAWIRAIDKDLGNRALET